MSKTYSLRKSKNILKGCYKWVQKNGDVQGIQAEMEKLDQAIVDLNRPEADRLARELETIAKKHFGKSLKDYVVEIVFALVFALAIATVVRQMWFELYEIPSGSMRPTFREQDHLTVTKTAFGLNIPLKTEHFYFDPDLVQNTGVVIWSGENIPGADDITTYFKIFPYTKRYIKRMAGKPGDSIYFYGGKIYAVDRDGKPLMDFLTGPWMEKIENIPFMYLDGRLKRNIIEYALVKQPLARYDINSGKGEIYNGSQWIQDEPSAAGKKHDKIETFSDIWGIGNFAVAKLLLPSEVPDEMKKELGEDGVLYLLLNHSPRLPRVEDVQYESHGHISVPTSPSLIPLKQEQLDALMKNMYTARFVVDKSRIRGFPFPKVPDGTYEFYFGKGSSVGWGGILHDLPLDHPLNLHTPENVLVLFNICMELHPTMVPHTQKVTYLPHRYAYYRDGDLYVMGAPFLKKGDPLLQKFTDKEKEKESNKQYVGFLDRGAPLKTDGNFDVDFIRAFGLKVPEKQYLLLGDNHAISADSRVFGFIPEDNLQGAPSFILWPPGERWGFPAQKPYPIFNVPRLIIWGTALGIYLIWLVIQRKNLRRRVIKK